jgi:transglutaminase-like putative cysteine protease
MLSATPKTAAAREKAAGAAYSTGLFEQTAMRLKANTQIILKSPERGALLAILRPQSGAGQWIVSETYDVKPLVAPVEYVDVFGNLCQRFVMPKGKLELNVECVVETPDTIATAPDAPYTAPEELPNEVLHFLAASRYCPSDMMVSQAKEIAGNVRPGYAQVEAIRSWIEKNIEYKRGTSDEHTSGLDTYKLRAGVCRDFAHVGVTLCRALTIPARMVVGYLHKLQPPMDQHAWFEAFVGGRWYTFDATQKEPRGGRIVIAYGRDAADVAITTPFGPIEVDDMTVTVERVDQPAAHRS